MRFDPARVLDLAGSLNEPRLANTPGESRAAELIARELDQAGWSVERVANQRSWLARLIAVERADPSTHVIGTLSGGSGRPVRVILLSRLRTSRPARPVSGENRTGLALLAELARVWPRGAREQVETWMIACADHFDLARQLRPRLADGTPTLVITLDAPGVGPEVVIAGRGKGPRLAAEAAETLWIPYRRTRTATCGTGLVATWVWQLNRRPAVELRGAHDDRPIDPAALTRVASLVMEMALRWGKRAADSHINSKASQ